MFKSVHETPRGTIFVEFQIVNGLVYSIERLCVYMNKNMLEMERRGGSRSKMHEKQAKRRRRRRRLSKERKLTREIHPVNGKYKEYVIC